MQTRIPGNKQRKEGSKKGPPTALCKMLVAVSSAWLGSCVYALCSMTVMRRVLLLIEPTGARCAVCA